MSGGDDDRLWLEALDELPVYVSIVEGPEFEVIAVNRQVREGPMGSTVGMKLSDFYPRDKPPCQALERVYATGVAETLHEHPTYFPDGRYGGKFYNRTFVPLRDGPTGAKRIMVCVHEVTDSVTKHARDRAEQDRLYALLEDCPCLISVLEGPELRLVMVNRLMREFFSAFPSPLGARLSDLVAPDNETLLAAHRVYATGVPETVAVVVRDIEGFLGRSFSTTVAPIRGADGTITRLVSASIEDTDERRVRETLEAQARDLEEARRVAVEAGQAKDQFLAMLGHELRNPLAPIVGAIQVMQLEGRSSQSLEILERQVAHMTRLVDDLLDISRFSRGVVEIKRTEVELATIVTRALELASPLLEARDHRVVTDMVHRGLGLWADRDRIAQVVANLITNAAKYSEAKSRIQITAQRLGERVQLSVADEGVGIAPQMLDKVFEAFVQQPQTLDRSRGGLGLGLAIARSLVVAHGGTIAVHSEGLGRGSTFTIDLPAMPVELRVRPRVETPPSPLPFIPAASPSATPRRILVVDDNRDAADVLRIGLGALGHTITCAYDGPSALALAEAIVPHVALIDIGLPIMDGYRLAELLRARHDIPMVAISGYADRERSAVAGFAAHLVKPVDLGDLATLIDQLPD